MYLLKVSRSAAIFAKMYHGTLSYSAALHVQIMENVIAPLCGISSFSLHENLHVSTDTIYKGKTSVYIQNKKFAHPSSII